MRRRSAGARAGAAPVRGPRREAGRVFFFHLGVRGARRRERGNPPGAHYKRGGGADILRGAVRVLSDAARHRDSYPPHSRDVRLRGKRVHGGRTHRPGGAARSRAFQRRGQPAVRFPFAGGFGRIADAYAGQLAGGASGDPCSRRESGHVWRVGRGVYRTLPDPARFLRRASGADRGAGGFGYSSTGLRLDSDTGGNG